MRIVKCVFRQRERFEKIPGFVYCGREFGGFPKSPLANPFKVTETTPLEASLAMYRGWLWNKILTEDSCKDYLRVFVKEDSVLGCWCLNKDEAGTGKDECHCDVIAKATRWLRKLEAQRT